MDVKMRNRGHGEGEGGQRAREEGDREHGKTGKRAREVGADGTGIGDRGHGKSGQRAREEETEDSGRGKRRQKAREVRTEARQGGTEGTVRDRYTDGEGHKEHQWRGCLGREFQWARKVLWNNFVIFSFRKLKYFTAKTVQR
jgi:hypothetical protein